MYSETFEDLMSHLHEVICRSARLTVNPKMVKFAQTKISFLRHLIQYKGVNVNLR